MMPQLTVQQVEAALKAITARIDAKKLEVDSLSRMQQTSRVLIQKLFSSDETVEESLAIETVHDYLIAKLNQGLMDLEQLTLQKTMFESQQRQVQLASGVLPNNRRPQG